MTKLFLMFKDLLMRHKLWDLFTYCFFGGLATIVNIVSFGGATHIGLSWQVANFIAWVLSVLFAFVTNKLWVFNSHTNGFGELTWEFVKFVLARIVSLGIDYSFMFLFISIFGLSNMIAKLLTQFAVVIANYALSKFVIFKHKPSDVQEEKESL